VNESPTSAAAASAPARVLVVDDQTNMRTTTALMLRQEGYSVEEAGGGQEAVEKVLAEPFDVILTDLRMEPVSGMELLSRVLEIAPSTQVIMMTAYGTIEGAVEAMRRGAADYVTKPFQAAELVVRIQKAQERRRLEIDINLLVSDNRDRYRLENIIGRSKPIQDLLGRVVRVAPTDTTVLITGESGTGKELIARALHNNSKRATRPFIPVNCAAVSETLLESELFGHARGSFTGAVSARRGLFEEANGGSFFFDEIAETTPAFQAKLLRAIQEHEIKRVGENNAVKVDVRIIAATNKDLKKAVADRSFREDLYYRLAVVPLRVPPLRERREDIQLIGQHFLERFNQRNGTKRVFTQGAMARMMGYDFPGNVRELENVVEQAASLAPADEINAEDVLLEADGPPPESGPGSLKEAVDAAERKAIEAARTMSPGDLSSVARQLGVSGTTLWRKMKRLGIGS
jgi:two-component system response regulator HydG